jgi:hypothetical protein
MSPEFIIKGRQNYTSMKYPNLYAYIAELSAELLKKTAVVADLQRKLSEDHNKQNIVVDDL